MPVQSIPKRRMPNFEPYSQCKAERRLQSAHHPPTTAPQRSILPTPKPPRRTLPRLLKHASLTRILLLRRRPLRRAAFRAPALTAHPQRLPHLAVLAVAGIQLREPALAALGGQALLLDLVELGAGGAVARPVGGAGDDGCDREELRVDAPPEHDVGAVVVLRGGSVRALLVEGRVEAHVVAHRPRCAEERAAGEHDAQRYQWLFFESPRELFGPRFFEEVGVFVE